MLLALCALCFQPKSKVFLDKAEVKYDKQGNQIDCSQDYCVADPYARCDIKDYPSDESDFVWGCSDPRRPIRWKEE